MAVDPATGKAFAEIPRTAPEQARAMIDDARRALAAEAEWRDGEARVRVLRDVARALAADADALAELETRDTGIPLRHARRAVAAAVRHFERVAAPLGEARPGAWALPHPWGVCALLLPAEPPLERTARFLAAALAAGNAALVRPDDALAITPLRLAQLADEAGVPRGLVQVATGGTEALLAGADHLTLSAPTPATVPFVLEPAGPPTAIVFADAGADFPLPAPWHARILVERTAYDALRARLDTARAALTVGPGVEDPDVAPPTVDLDAAVTLAPFDHEPEAIAQAAGAVSVWTRDLARAHRVAAALSADRVALNGDPAATPDPALYTRRKRVTLSTPTGR
ncbi:MAG TPA: aldehyde dehydrogenase family protein [Solirubrobacter sp.]|nr:aldehyde dehydrogenase family protein [Solirubrobacter sp.]